MSAKAYYSEEDRCWYVPCSSELLQEAKPIEPVRLELKDGQLWITLLEREAQVTDEMIERASRAVEATFHFLGLPGTRMPGMESVDCQMVARVALETAMGGGVMEMDR